MAAAPASAVADIPLTAEASVLVLRNGYVLRGQVVALGDYYLVSQSDSDQIRIPVSRVEMVCDNLEQAYARKRDAVIPGDVRSHLALASWCLRHRIHARAADQILAAYALDPGNPRIPPLKNQLRSATRPNSQAKRQSKPAEELPADLQVTQLPADSMRQFTAHVQPLLLNRCATGACHDRGSPSGFQLVRPPVGQSVTSRLTQRNLRAALAYITPRSPFESPLLKVPQRPHGGLNEPVLGTADSAQSELLIEWIQQLRVRVQPESARVRKPNTLLQRVPANSMPAASDTQADSADKDQHAPRDPFDPEVFNRGVGSRE